jgi:metal-sulfur cluster biosynthetic enzyme
MRAKPTPESVRDVLQIVRHPEINDNVVNLGMIHTVEIHGREVTIHVALPLEDISPNVRHQLAENIVAACKQAHPDTECLIHFEKMSPEEHDRFCEMASQEWAE